MKTEKETIEQLLERIKVAPSVSNLAAEMKEIILQDVNRRITASSRHRMWLRIGAVAASVLLLFGVSNYLSYHQGYKKQNSQWVKMENPLGMKSTIMLSDGTTVILNAGSTLLYPSDFVAETRTVQLRGEAFFDVSHNTKHPFIVEADHVNVHVFGTQFNVKAYDEDKDVEVTLTEGCVGVGLDEDFDLLKMLPGEQVLFDKANHTFSKQQVNLVYFTSWKEGKLYFQRLTFADIARQLERIYNVDIEIASEKLKQVIFTGDFVRGENLEQILRVMTADKRMKYKIEGDQVRIYD